MALYEIRDTVRPHHEPERLLIDGVESDFWVTCRESRQRRSRPLPGFRHLVIWKNDKGVYAYSGYWASGLMKWARDRQEDNRASVRIL